MYHNLRIQDQVFYRAHLLVAASIRDDPSIRLSILMLIIARGRIVAVLATGARDYGRLQPLSRPPARFPLFSSFLLS